MNAEFHSPPSNPLKSSKQLQIIKMRQWLLWTSVIMVDCYWQRERMTMCGFMTVSKERKRASPILCFIKSRPALSLFSFPVSWCPRYVDPRNTSNQASTVHTWPVSRIAIAPSYTPLPKKTMLSATKHYITICISIISKGTKDGELFIPASWKSRPWLEGGTFETNLTWYLLPGVLPESVHWRCHRQMILSCLEPKTIPSDCGVQIRNHVMWVGTLHSWERKVCRIALLNLHPLSLSFRVYSILPEDQM